MRGLALACLGFVANCVQQADCPPVPSADSRAATTQSTGAASNSAAKAVASEAALLVFKEGGAERAAISASTLAITIAPETVVQFDPYYNREKRYKALPLAAVIERGFKGVNHLPQQEFILHAKDGNAVSLRGSKVFESGAYIAVEDLDVAGWEPIGQQRANPGPYYLIWANKDQTDLETHPRPYQLATIEVARFEDVFPRTVPKSAANSEAHKGFGLFREQCLHCHSINRQGGKLGPELNLPQSIVEYRPVEQIKAYIKNPLTFRYSTMPAHEKLSQGELNSLIAYFSEMKTLKQSDPAK